MCVYVYTGLFHTLRAQTILFLWFSSSAPFPFSSHPDCSCLIPSYLHTLLGHFFFFFNNNITVQDYDIPTTSSFFQFLCRHTQKIWVGCFVCFFFFFRAGTQHFQELGVFNNSNVCVVLKASHPCFNTGCPGTYFSMALGSGLGLEHQDELIWQDFVSPSEAGKWQIPFFFSPTALCKDISK